MYRKIAFVSLTRAKERVMISYANKKRLPNYEVEKCGPSNLVNALLSIPGIQLTHEKNVDMVCIHIYMYIYIRIQIL
jgi:superfamily I DNA/RNA helicase